MSAAPSRFVAPMHRWLGMATCLLFFVWYASGIVMTFAQMPALTEDEREAALPALDVERVRLSPAEAVARAAPDSPPAAMRLTSLFGRPVYRLSGARPLTVFADDGKVLDCFSFQEAKASLGPYLASTSTPWRLESVLSEPDQWTLAGRYRNLRPLFRVLVDDAAGTVLYVSGASGDVVLKTTRRTRALAWAGAIPHWLYITALRRHLELWRLTVLAATALAGAVCVLGLILGVGDWLRPVRVPLRGALRWHLWLGTAFGLTALVWVASGAMTLDPFPALASGGTFTESPANDAPVRWESFTLSARQVAQAAGPGVSIREIDFVEADRKPYYRVIASRNEDRFLDGSGRPAPSFSEDFLMASAQRTMGTSARGRQTLLTRYDSYYYDRASRRPLPVWRVEFADPAGTWLYLDPARGALVARVDRGARRNRWLSDGLHRLDLPFLPRGRWHTALVVLLCAGGCALSATGIVLSLMRLGS